MKTESIYNQLKEAFNNFNYSKEPNYAILIKLQEKLENEMKAESVKDYSSKQRVNYALRLVKKLREKTPVLSYCYNGLENENGEKYQTFTDSFFMVSLLNNDKLPLENVEDTKMQYPNLERVFQSKTAVESMDYSFIININKLLNIFKINKTILIDLKIKSLYGYQLYISLAYDTFKNFITFMNYKNSEDITFHFGKTNNEKVKTPIHAINKNGSIGLMLPCYFDSIENAISIEELQ